MKFKDCIRFIVMLAFVITTAPTVGHAAMGHDSHVESEQTLAAQVNVTHDCCPPDIQDQTENKVSDKAPGKDGCCDKDGKCVGATCNTVLKVFSHVGGYTFPPLVGKANFLVSNEPKASDLSDRIKRPPRA